VRKPAPPSGGSMNLGTLTQLVFVTLLLCFGVVSAVTAAQRVNVSENWDELRCDPYVMLMSAFYKPSIDPRSPSEFARDNWKFCQKQYIQQAISLAAEAPRRLLVAAEDNVGAVTSMVNSVADLFSDIWKVCYQTYASFMERMKKVAKLFQNFMINLYSIVERMDAAVLSIIFGLVSFIVTIINTIKLTILIATIVIGIILAMMILMFYLLAPISGLIAAVSAILAASAAVALAMIASVELFTDKGACFVTGTPVMMAGGITKPIESVRIGDILYDGGVVTACHEFWSNDPVYDVHGVGVTGDHLILECGKMIPVREHRNAVRRELTWLQRLQGGQPLWCLTTSTRCIQCNVAATFADWEEIPESDEAALGAWYQAVWKKVNGEAAVGSPPPSDEAGFTADTLVACKNLVGRRVYRRIADIRVGEYVFVSETETTVVVGVVVSSGDLESDAVMLPGLEGRVRGGTWVYKEPLWSAASSVAEAAADHPVRWYHLYTKKGVFVLQGGWQVRDASDVGLGAIHELVEATVLKKTPRVV